MDWREVPENAALVPGNVYRWTLFIKAPYSRFLAERLRDAIKVGTGLQNLDPTKKLNERVTIRSITWDLPMVSSHTGGRSEPWAFRVEFRAAAKSEVNQANAALVIYGLIAAIAMAAVAVLIAGKKLESLVDTTAGAVKEVLGSAGDAAKSVLNPGLVLAAFVVGVLFLTRR